MEVQLIKEVDMIKRPQDTYTVLLVLLPEEPKRYYYFPVDVC